MQYHNETAATVAKNRATLNAMGGSPLPQEMSARYVELARRVRQYNPNARISGEGVAGYATQQEVARLEGMLIQLVDAKKVANAAKPLADANAPLTDLYQRYTRAWQTIGTIQAKMKQGDNPRLLALMNVSDDLYREPALDRKQWNVGSINDAPKALQDAQAKTLEMEIFLRRAQEATKILSMDARDQILTIAERLKEMCELVGAHIPSRDSAED